ncbi:MAG: uracil-xanthine permease family protein [Deltaproteobacteria bacterium]|nr:uracil-xanthine permease family protein [Deltaproteobacteria bacterium]
MSGQPADKYSLSSLDYAFSVRQCVVGAQMLFVAFGALVLVPILTGLDPNVALFTAGIGTLAFQIVTRGKVPIFLASSFAFIAPIQYGMRTWGPGGTMCGVVAAGVLYLLVSSLIRWKGLKSVYRLLPPIVTGPVIMVIGLSLSPSAVHMALGRTGDGSAVLFPVETALPVALAALAATIVVSIYGKGFLRLVPILSGILVGYLAALVAGIVDFSIIAKAPWLGLPAFVRPTWNLQAAILFFLVGIAPFVEHVGNILAVGAVTGRNYAENPGLHRTLLGDGIATSLAGFFGGPPNTTYAEVTGGITLVRAFNPAVLTWAALTALALSFVTKLGAVLQSIPTPVMGGIMILLFGAISVVGMNLLVRAGEDLVQPRNMAIVAIVLVFGIGGMVFSAGDFVLEGIGLAGVTGIVLNLILPNRPE